MRVPAGQVVGLIVVNIVISVVLPNISLVAHLGGLAVGAAATAALVYAPRGNRNGVQAAALAGLALALLVVVAVAGMLI
jgi:membrane associated rhomboid family serine protease